MNPFIPFIHTPERKKKENEPLPLYIEAIPPMERPQQEEEKEEQQRVVIIELF